MSIEAFIWNYRDGEPVGFAYDVVRDILSTKATSWDGEHGCLNVWFENPVDCVDIYLGKDAPNTNHVGGIMIARPLAHPDYLARHDVESPRATAEALMMICNLRFIFLFVALIDFLPRFRFFLP